MALNWPNFLRVRKPPPDHIEVTLRVCLSLIVAYALALGSYPAAVPPSQQVLIAAATSAFGMVMPTLMFAVGAGLFPGLFVTVLVACVFSTALLAVAAAGGTVAYVVAFFFVALVFSGLRFSRDQSGMAAVLIMFTALNTMGLQGAAVEEGLPFVRSLWTESGIDNPNAAFQNTFIGICWVSFCICVARLVPPFRTARSLFSRKLLPKILKEVAEFIRLIVAHHENSNNDVEGGANENSGGEDGEGGDEDEKINGMIGTILQDGRATVGGGVAGLTAFEPRIFRVCCQCGAPVDIVERLVALTNAVNNMIIASLALRSFSKGGFSPSTPEMISGLRPSYIESTAILDKCVGMLVTFDCDEDNTVTTEETQEGLGVPLITAGEDEEQTPYDPLRLKNRALKVKKLTEEFVHAMGPIDRSRSIYDKTARKVYISGLMPWIKGAGVGLVLTILVSARKLISATTWKRIFLPPHYDLHRLVWCLKFALGFTLLVIMEIYWPSFASLYILPWEEHKSAAFSGWFLIAYAFGTTQTVEGTVKKSLLRAAGTVGGGFCAWVALTAGNGPIFLGAWLVVTNTWTVYFGLPSGIGSRFGLDKDLAWGPAYFAMTNALVVLEVYMEVGGRNDITVNRIASNLVGIAMAMLMAVIPPGIYGNSPREARFLLEDTKRAFRECIRLSLDKSDPQRLNHLYSTYRAVFLSEFKEAKGNFDDAHQLHRLCVLKPNPKMELGLDALAVLGSSILSLIRFGVALAETDGEIHFDPEEVQMLEIVLRDLDIEDDPHKTSSFHVHSCAREGRVHKRPGMMLELSDNRNVASAHATFARFCVYILDRIYHCEMSLEEIRFGFCGEQGMGPGRKSGSVAEL